MSLKRMMLVVAVLNAMCLAAVITATAAEGEGADRIELEELKAMLGSPDLVVVDVRRGEDWEKSDIKIKGAIREDPKLISEWFSKYPKDKTLVFYCA
ncbi:MAG: hypothetical protein HY913_00750 [Desulfomonile tiedjei]|nr:hypothetical protein [Desulfomonile tiedjei]